MIECNGNIFDEADCLSLGQEIRKIAPELLNKYDITELASLYCDYSEEIWSSSWEDDMEGEFVKWLEDPDSVRKARLSKDYYNKTFGKCSNCEYCGTWGNDLSPCNHCKDHSEYSDKEEAKRIEEINNINLETREQFTKDILKEFVDNIFLNSDSIFKTTDSTEPYYSQKSIKELYKEITGEEYEM